ncbi:MULTISPECIES: MBL fold metallo-hydrolase [Sphingobium]|jgi:L-ascorbate metabolism protein UlaG (beta-lactamase superfamily)|uniref:MBL fold metallo-hydrolase n=1 Tax=Sphingobium fuliginis (strain ATCC 27551) TaxID=336203 RepID=A0A292ZAM0_SPHSA|nr:MULTISPECIES: MBL fold metallo-hydrolase [Sphingobium]QOT71429.1 MBL fold metallo-hydrolase [Sphingobium fuliginis]GAY19815.1 outer membrane protein romA [Sphingobium fuliginis]
MGGIVGKIVKGLGVALLFLVVALCLAVTVVPPFLDRIYYEGPVTRHYDGERFFNPDGDIRSPAPAGGNPRGFIARWLLGQDDRPSWPDMVAVKPSRPPAFAAPRGMIATWVGHATVLVQAAGLNILTDPIWSDHASPFPPLGPRRVAQPGVRFDDLPRIDLILLSHNHYDHMDIPTLKRLWKRDRPKIVTSLGNDAILKANGIPSTALDWGQSISGAALNGLGDGTVIQCENYEHCPDYRVHVLRNHHWSSRWGTDRSRALWSSFFVSTRAGNIFFAGDTGAGDMAWPADAARLGPIRLAMIPIGAFRFHAGQMQSDSHVGPEQAVQIFEKLKASTAIPIHWGTFRLSYEKWDTPPKMLELQLRCAGIERRRFAPLRVGQSILVPGWSPVPHREKRCDPGAIARLK